MKAVNVQKLTEELVADGIPIHGCSSDGRIDFKDEATDTHKAQAAIIFSLHDVSETTVQKLRAFGLDKTRAALLLRLSTGFNSLPLAQKNRIQAIIDSESAKIVDIV